MQTGRRMFGRMKRREKILLGSAVGSLALYLAAAALIIPAVRGWTTTGLLIEEKEAVLAGYRETLDKEKTLTRRLQALEASGASFDRFMLKSEKPPLAAAELQNRVKAVAENFAALDITSEKIAPPTKGDRYVNIPVEISVSGGIEPLRDFLYELETGLPLLTIPDVTVRSNKKRIFDAPSKKYLDVEELQFTILLNGMMKGSL
jgi:hypothetical protein